MANKHLFFAFFLFVFPLTLCAGNLSKDAIDVDSVATEAASFECVLFGDTPTSMPAPVDASTRFNARQLVFPAIAISFASVSTAGHLIDTRSDRQKHQFENTLQYVPVGAYAALGFVPGVSHDHHIGDRLMAGATAYVLMTAAVQGTKRLVREKRPDSEGRNSFPSGHTATAFCGAELCRIEYGNAYGAAAYAFAAATGVMRVVNNRHWCNDVLAGAGIGFLAAHAGYWLLPAEKRLVQRIIRRPKMEHALLLAPSYQYETKAPSLAFSMTF